jgi:hypothetical protein
MLHAAQKFGAVADVGPPHMQRLGERRRRAVDGEVRFSTDRFWLHWVLATAGKFWKAYLKFSLRDTPNRKILLY